MRQWRGRFSGKDSNRYLDEPLKQPPDDDLSKEDSKRGTRMKDKVDQFVPGLELAEKQRKGVMSIFLIFWMVL
jgi:hypothetical protein